MSNTNVSARLARLEELASARVVTETGERITHDAAACASAFDAFAAEVGPEQRTEVARRAAEWGKYVKPRTTEETR